MNPEIALQHGRQSRQLKHSLGNRVIITSFYYMAYPDSLPPDDSVAASEVYVEVAEIEGDADNFDYTYSVFVYTIGYVHQILKKGSIFTARFAIIVDRFNDATIKLALESILPILNVVAQTK